MMTEENDETQKASEAENQEVLKESMATEPEADHLTAGTKAVPAVDESESENWEAIAIEQEVDVPQQESDQPIIEAIIEAKPSGIEIVEENPDTVNESAALELETDHKIAEIEPVSVTIVSESENWEAIDIEQEVDVPQEESDQAIVGAIIESTPLEVEIVEETQSEATEIAVEMGTEVDIESTPTEIEKSLESFEAEISTPEIIDEAKEQEVNSTSEMLDIKVPIQVQTSEDKTIHYPELNYDTLTKEGLLAFFESAKSIIQAQAASNTFKKIDEITKEAKIAFDKIKFAEKNEALASFKESNEQSEEGFFFKGDEINQKIDTCIQFIRGERQTFFHQIEKLREKALEGKTRLINELRVLADADDNSDPAHVNASFKAFKKLQDEWKSFGSVQGNMNQTLWQSYHALVDRFYSNRSIFFELLELDRKKNLQAKEVIAAKLEKLAEAIQQGVALQKVLKEAEELFEEYKHIGPAHRDANEAMWLRVKKSLDVLFEQKRQVNEAQKGIYQENLAVKKELADLMHHYTSFTSISISEWNQTSKAVLALQEQWGKLKGGLPREGGKEVSHLFWSDLKTFFKHKSEFFSKIDAERKANLAAKQLLVDQVLGIVETGTETPEITNMVIGLQKRWKDIGHVPEKQKDQIYAKFKVACDAYFNLKREKNKGPQDEEFEANLTAKNGILSSMQAMLKDAESLANLGTIKAEWDAIGYVPRKDVKNVQEKFRNSWNSLIDFARTQPAEKLAAWGFELKSLSTESIHSQEDRKPQATDFRKKIQALENDIAVLTNNLEFFAKSKNSDYLRAEVEKKISQAEAEIEKLKKS
jgi:hypothetical protein